MTQITWWPVNKTVRAFLILLNLLGAAGFFTTLWLLFH